MRKTAARIALAVMLVGLLIVAIINRNGALLPDIWVNYYSRSIYPTFSYGFYTFLNYFYFSVTENAVVILSIAAIPLVVLFVVSIVKLAKSKGKKALGAFLYKFMVAVLVVALVGVVQFQLMFGLNYARDSVSEVLGFENNESNDDSDEELLVDEYEAACEWAYQGMTQARSRLGEDYNGVTHIQTNFEECVYDANACITAFSEEYGLNLSMNYVRAKPVSLSNLWSQTAITGMNNPLFGEAIVNTDNMNSVDFPIALAHEITHARGISRENDANFVATMSLCLSSRADFRYAGFLQLYDHFRGVLIMIMDSNADLEVNIPGDASELAGVNRDLFASYAYWFLLEDYSLSDFINQLAEDTNDAYLESNEQECGTDTYNVPSSMYLDFYLMLVGTEESNESNT